MEMTAVIKIEISVSGDLVEGSPQTHETPAEPDFLENIAIEEVNGKSLTRAQSSALLWSLPVEMDELIEKALFSNYDRVR